MMDFDEIAERIIREHITFANCVDWKFAREALKRDIVDAQKEAADVTKKAIIEALKEAARDAKENAG
jgi:hypothetical protein